MLSSDLLMYLALVCFFLWGRCSQTCQESRPQSTRVTPAEVCRLDYERLRAMEAIRFKSWSYIVICSLYMEYVHLLVVLMCNLMWSLMCSLICASSYDIVVLMCLFWFIWQASGAGSHSAFPHTMLLDDDEEICYGKQAKEDINFITQKMFSYGPYESHKYLQYYASCWFLWIF